MNTWDRKCGNNFEKKHVSFKYFRRERSRSLFFADNTGDRKKFPDFILRFVAKTLASINYMAWINPLDAKFESGIFTCLLDFLFAN